MGGFVDDQEVRVLEENAVAEGFGAWWLACHERVDGKQISPQRHKEHEGLTRESGLFFLSPSVESTRTQTKTFGCKPSCSLCLCGEYPPLRGFKSVLGLLRT
jgi:hypothetical protein